MPITPITLITHYVHPPIPSRHNDWCAYEKGTDQFLAQGPSKDELLLSIGDIKSQNPQTKFIQVA